MDDIVDQVWRLLETGANPGKARSPFTLLQAATIGLDGAPTLRNVVLRRASREHGAVMFHTDVRSAKVAELRRDPRIALTGCDYDAGLQLRLSGIARIVTDPALTRSVWESSRPRSLIVYRAPLAPSTPVASPEAAHAPAQSGDDAAGFEHFCLVDVSVAKIDFLDLDPAGHRRAALWLEEGRWTGHWIAP